MFEWFSKFHNQHHVLKSIYKKFTKEECLYNERYLAMLMHLAIPAEFESIIEVNNSGNSNSNMIQSFDEMSEAELR